MSKKLLSLIFIMGISSLGVACSKKVIEQETDFKGQIQKEIIEDKKPEKQEEIIDLTSDAKQEDLVVPKDSVWYDLYNKLKEDGIHGADIDAYFKQLEGKFSEKPMGIKVKELYNIKNKPKPEPTDPDKKPEIDTEPNPTGVPRPWYKGFVTEAIALKCKDFIDSNLETFELMEETYDIPREIVSSLIFVETKHGNYLGEHNPLINLASMSISTDTEQIPSYIEQLPLAEEQNEWILGKMAEKSTWAYSELKALLRYCQQNKIDPMKLPSSVYGALGFGQFMPSNIPKLAVDGDSDGIINLFEAPDGIMSVANYLSKTGWNKSEFTLKEKIKIIMRYNYSSVYARTILALAFMTNLEIEKANELEEYKELEARDA